MTDIVRKTLDLRPGIQLTRTYYVGFRYFPIPLLNTDEEFDPVQEQELEQRLDRFESFDHLQMRIERTR